MTAPTIDPVSQRIVGCATVTTLEFAKITDRPYHQVRSHRRPSAWTMHGRRVAVAIFAALALVLGTLALAYSGPGPTSAPPTMQHP